MKPCGMLLVCFCVSSLAAGSTPPNPAVIVSLLSRWLNWPVCCTASCCNTLCPARLWQTPLSASLLHAYCLVFQCLVSRAPPLPLLQAASCANPCPLFACWLPFFEPVRYRARAARSTSARKKPLFASILFRVRPTLVNSQLLPSTLLFVWPFCVCVLVCVCCPLPQAIINAVNPPTAANAVSVLLFEGCLGEIRPPCYPRLPNLAMYTRQ